MSDFVRLDQGSPFARSLVDAGKAEQPADGATVRALDRLAASSAVTATATAAVASRGVSWSVVAVVAFAAVAAGVVVVVQRGRPRVSGALPTTTIGDDRLAEATSMVARIRVAQEAFHSETGSYANISTALASNLNTNHFALYPRAPGEPGVGDALGWGAPCAAQACNSGWDWSELPVHADGPLRFGYSTIAGRSGQRPTAAVTIDGRAVTWPVPSGDWYIVTAVGDVDGSGVLTTVLADSFSPDIRIDRGGPRPTVGSP